MRHYYLLLPWTPKIVRVFFLTVVIFALGRISGRSSRHNLLMKLRLLLVFEQSVDSGAAVIQSGVDMARGNSFIRHQRALVGASGHVVGIEPDLRNINMANSRFRSDIEQGRLSMVSAALANKSGVMRINFGTRSKWNRLQHIPAPDKATISPVDGEEVAYLEESVEVYVMTVDEVVEKYDVAIDRLALLSLQINGSEYESLLGAEKTLKHASNLTILVATGRQFEGSLGVIEGRPDYEVIAEYLGKFGYISAFCRMWPDNERFGFIVARRAGPPAFWNS